MELKKKLKYLRKQMDVGGNASKYIQVSQLLNFFANIGYKLSVLNLSISELLKKELIETDDLISDIEWKTIGAEDFNICIAAKGDYYLRNAMNRFHYYDLILQDTPIFNKDFFDAIKAQFPHANNKGIRVLEDRLSTVKEFMNYLREMEKTQHHELIKLYGSIVRDVFVFGLKKDFCKIESKIPSTSQSNL